MNNPKNYILFLLLFCFSPLASAQYVIIETGRPKPLLTRNAQEIVGKKFKIEYQYQAFRSDEAQMAEIKSVNDASYAALEKKWGKDWREKVFNAVALEEKKLLFFQDFLFQQGTIDDNNLVYFRKSIFNKYIAEIYPAIEPENKSKENRIKKVKIKFSVK